MKDIDAYYYGYLDDEDGVLIKLEEEVEQKGLFIYVKLCVSDIRFRWVLWLQEMAVECFRKYSPLQQLQIRYLHWGLVHELMLY